MEVLLSMPFHCITFGLLYLFAESSGRGFFSLIFLIFVFLDEIDVNMEIIRFSSLFLILGYFFNQKRVLGYSCDYDECSCLDDMIICVDVTAPRFKFRATVSMLYMDNIQILNLKDIFESLPNLRYCTLMNMQYFNCKWLEDLPKYINLKRI